MRKRMFCFVMTLLFIFAFPCTVLAANVNENNGSEVPTSGPDTSYQILYAKMQLELAEIARQQAMENLNQISKIQDEQRLVADFLNTAKQCREEAIHHDTETEMPSDMENYLNANGLSYDTTGGDLHMTGTEWSTAIASLENRMTELNIQAQQTMLNTQNYIGQYNTSLYDTNTVNRSQLISSIARGQSMYGNSEVGLAVTGLVVGLTLGCAITLAAQKFRRTKEKV